MTQTKITQKMFFNALKNFIGEGEQITLDGITYTDVMLTEFINSQIDKLNKKSSHKSQADKEKDLLNEKIRNEIVSYLTGIEEPVGATQLSMILSDRVGEFVSSQRVTPQLTKLVADEMVVKMTEKGKTFYKIA
jgi:hypothetical protein